ncbi:glutathione S-transferase family protein [Ramlibacter pallidus]|uniref:Glutathione S-transferase family protein n=1 Tax=Ramlibacter pallidus TaxID=2780087 RepID=A0ABR9RZ24_9BURK|nr:glutathione S-transferase family protein [Ramlibacter pallidus]MBE7366077.1 glutathione S-transferase family protein [Ramlibacter pallidus]
MALTLHYHPLSSFCHKVLVALHELGVPFEGRLLDLGDAAQREAFHRLWPTGKMPLLVDDGEVVPESSIIIEHVATRHAWSQTLLPADPREQLEVRLYDRIFDQYVMQPMQAAVADRLRQAGERDPLAVAAARRTLAMAYGLLDQRMEGREWAAGRDFSMADCAAAPSLFFAATIEPFAPGQRHLAAYLARLLERPSVARVLDEARPYFRFYPVRENLPAAYRPAGA